MERLKQTVCNMMTENTGSALCDSGDAYGRHWQKNQGLTVEALDAMPSASLEIWHHEKYGYDLSPTINVYHFLVNSLDLDEICEAFNALPVEDWDGDGYGLSRAGQEWLEERGFTLGETFNTYNWESTLSQVLQYTYLQSPDFDGFGDDRGDYLLLQIHGGCDVRGGYTDAKLFKIDCDYFGYEACGFSVDAPDDWEGEENHGYLTLDWSGEWISAGGSPADKNYMATFASVAFQGRENEESYITIHGDSWA